MGGHVGSVWVGLGCQENPLEDVVEGAKVLITCRGVERAPYIAGVRRRFDIKVVKPQKDWGPGRCKGLGKRGGDQGWVRLGAAGWVTACHV